MDHLLLRSWLGLDPGPWPPDHYALLGLPPGQCDPTAVETVVLDRMERLRPHQLLHPELVTEGMNRLAQALVCLTDPAARAAYDASLGFPPASAPGLGDPALLLDQSPQVVPYELVDETAPEPIPLPPAYEVIRDDEPRPRPAYEVVEFVEAVVVSPPQGPWQSASRRELFARLAAVRRLVAAWQQLRPYLGDPTEPLSRPVQVLVLLEQTAELRAALAPLRDLVGEPGRPGGVVAALVAQPLTLHTLRLLLPDQRRAVAVDWRRGEAALAREYARLRELVRAGRPVQPGRRRLGRFGWVVRTPELALAALAVAVLVVVLIRTRGRW